MTKSNRIDFSEKKNSLIERHPPPPNTQNITRYPTIESPTTVQVERIFQILVSLTGDQITPETEIKHTDKTVAVTEDGKISMRFPAYQEEWEIDIVMTSSDFAFPKGYTGSILLPKNGDSTPALFHLKAKPITTPRKTSKIYATLWHEGAYLARIFREIQIVNPKAIRTTARAAPVQADFAEASLRTAAAQSRHPSLALQEDPPDELAKTDPVQLNFALDPPDLTVFVIEDKKPDGSVEAQIQIYSQFLRPPVMIQYEPVPSDLKKWLQNYYAKFARHSRRSKVIYGAGGSENTPRTSKAQVSSLMRGFGKQLYHKFAPSAFKQAFWELSNRLGSEFDSIQILSNNPRLPWELMLPVRNDGSEERTFLGLEFKIGRWHIGGRSGLTSRPGQSIAFEKLVVIAPKYQGVRALPGQIQEIDVLKKLSGYSRLKGDFQSLEALFADLPQGIIHFAGHGIIHENDGASDFAILLEDAELDVMAWRGLVSTGRQTSPFFFFNACDVGQSRRVANFVDGWAPAVLETGASGYIGALWPLGDKGAAEFAEIFYQLLTSRLANSPASVSDVLREARRGFLENGDPTFLAYIFYGDPNLRFARR